ncbi:MAG: nuclear transport factor 2 family protein [Desulfarculaceae bacterium]
MRGLIFLRRGFVGVFLVLIVIGMAAPVKSRAEQWSAEQKEIWKLEEARWKALANKDISESVKYHHKDCSIWPAWSKDPLDAAAYEAQLKWRAINSFKLEPLTLKIYQNVAVIFYRFSCVGTDNKTYKGRVIRVRLKKDGVWQVIGGMGAALGEWGK